VVIRLLSEQDIRAVGLSLPDIVALVERAYALDAQGLADVPTKIGVHPDYPNSFLHAMPAWVDGARALGMKWVSYFPGNFARGLPDATGVIILNHPDHGSPVCIMEGMYVTFVRTAACAAVAVKHLACKPPRRLGLVGCGGLGRWTLRVMTSAFPSIDTVCVASRTSQSRQEFCTQMREEGSCALMPVDDVRSAIEGMDIVVASIPPTSERPVRPEWLSPGSIFIPLDLVNSWQDGVLAAAARVVADNPSHFADQVRRRRPAALPGLGTNLSLQDVVAGQRPQAQPSDRTFVAVCGIASTDVVIGWEIFRLACAAGVGSEFAMR
jgi:ornithine cyclodeaminase/alanine dehydrogenase-like protein (mu-crystallin family)